MKHPKQTYEIWTWLSEYHSESNERLQMKHSKQAYSFKTGFSMIFLVGLCTCLSVVRCSPCLGKSAIRQG